MPGKTSGREKPEAEGQASVLLSSRPDLNCGSGAHQQESLGPQEGGRVGGREERKEGGSPASLQQVYMAIIPQAFPQGTYGLCLITVHWRKASSSHLRVLGHRSG